MKDKLEFLKSTTTRTIIILLLTVNGWLVQAGINSLDDRVETNTEDISILELSVNTHVVADTTNAKYATKEMIRLTVLIDELTIRVNELSKGK